MLFPSFFMGGFECSTHIDRSRRRQDYIVLTQHDRFVREDYERARSIGLRVVREGLRWHLCDHGQGRYDFSSIAPMVDAALACGISQILCLMHYGFPDGVHPLQPDFEVRFTNFSAAFARWRRARVPAPRWYGAINELSLLSYAAGEVGWFYPFLVGQGDAVKQALVRTSLRATDAVRAEDPQARFVSIDPVLQVVPSRSHAEVAESVHQQNLAQFEAWDMAAGRVHPELGGGAQYLDVIGLNCYPDSQKEQPTGSTLALGDPRRRPFRDMLLEVWQRYQRPIIVAETAARGDERPSWLRYVVDECLAAMRQGVDLQGICQFPLVDMREWRHGSIVPARRNGAARAQPMNMPPVTPTTSPVM